MRKRIIDISQEVFGCSVFPGDPQPIRKTQMSIDNGDVCNLTEISMCAHNGTHVDAPYHFINDGRKIDEMPLECFVGKCFVCRHEGDVTADDAKTMLKRSGSCERLLIGGRCTVTADAARVFAEAGLKLIGNECQTVGPEDAPMEVHLILLGAEVILLEGIRLEGVAEGEYFLSAAPLCLGGSDGAPCRAYIMEI